MSLVPDQIKKTPFTESGNPENASKTVLGKRSRGRPPGSKNKKRFEGTLLDIPKETKADSIPVTVPMTDQPSATANTGNMPITGEVAAKGPSLNTTIGDTPGEQTVFDNEKTTNLTLETSKDAPDVAEELSTTAVRSDFVDAEGFNVGTQETVFGRIFNTGKPLIPNSIKPLTDQNALGNYGWVNVQRKVAHFDAAPHLYTSEDVVLKNPPLYSKYRYGGV